MLYSLLWYVYWQQEREHYEYIVVEGKIIRKLSGDLLHTSNASERVKWIFVMSTCKKLYVGEVRHHGPSSSKGILCFCLFMIITIYGTLLPRVLRPSKFIAEKEGKISSL